MNKQTYTTLGLIGLVLLLISCSEKIKINNTDTVKIVQKNLTFENIPENATLCFPENKYEQSCQWVKTVDNKYRRQCITYIVYEEECQTKITSATFFIYSNLTMRNSTEEPSFVYYLLPDTGIELSEKGIYFRSNKTQWSLNETGFKRK